MVKNTEQLPRRPAFLIRDLISYTSLLQSMSAFSFFLLLLYFLFAEFSALCQITGPMEGENRVQEALEVSAKLGLKYVG